MKIVKYPEKVILDDCKLIYFKDEYSFDMDPLQKNGETSLVINYLNLECDDKGVLLFVCGYCPIHFDNEIFVEPIHYERGCLRVLSEYEFIPGISYGINLDESWPLYVNIKKKWVCIGNPNLEDFDLIEFAPNTIAALKDDQIKALWLNPEGFPSKKS